MFVVEQLLDVISFSFMFIPYHAVKLLKSYSFWLSRLAAFHNSSRLHKMLFLLGVSCSEVYVSYTNSNLYRSDSV